jgi:PIN domain nuclease of toxin-antitoxin system
MIAVADTHAALWYLFDDPRLSPTARGFMQYAAALGLKVGISSITFAEILYLCEKGRIDPKALDLILLAMKNPATVFQEIPFDLPIVEKMRSVSRENVPDLPDRMIAATSLHLGVPRVSRDRKIQVSGIQTVW